MPNRIFYGCLGIAKCNGSPIEGVKSISLSTSRSLKSVFATGNKNPAGIFSNLPDIELSYTEYLKSIVDFDKEEGLSDYTGFVILAGSDTAKCLTAPFSTISFSQLLLSSVTYNLSVDEPFTVERKYKGWLTGGCTYGGLGPFSNCNSNVTKSLIRKGCFTPTAIPPEVSGHIIQSVDISFKLNREFINQFATMKPYASYVNLPVETSCTFEILAKSLSSFNFPEPVLCKNPSADSRTITLTIGKLGSLTLSKASLTSFSYSGAEATKGGSNLQASAVYTSYETPKDLKIFTIL